MKHRVKFAAALSVLALSLTACQFGGSEGDGLSVAKLNEAIEQLNKLKEQGADFKVPSLGEIETMAKDTVCPALRKESSNQAYQAAVSEIRQQFGLTSESADLIADVGASIWCPDEYKSTKQ